MEKVMRYALCTFVACLSVLVIAACGSSKSSSSSSSSAASTPASTGTGTTGDFSSQVGTICRDAYSKVKATLAQETQIKNGPGTNADKRAKISPLLGDFKTELSDLQTKLAALTAPSGQETAYKQYVNGLSTVADLTGQAKTALDHNDSTTYQSVNTKLQAEVKKSNASGSQVPALAPCVTGG